MGSWERRGWTRRGLQGGDLSAEEGLVGGLPEAAERKRAGQACALVGAGKAPLGASAPAAPRSPAEGSGAAALAGTSSAAQIPCAVSRALKSWA